MVWLADMYRRSPLPGSDRPRARRRRDRAAAPPDRRGARCRDRLRDLLVALWLIPAPAAAQAILDVELTYRVDVRTVDTPGIADDDIRAVSRLDGLREDGAVSPFVLVQRAAADRERIDRLLRAYGYYAATIGMTAAGVSLDGRDAADRLAAAAADAPADAAVTVTIAVDPGPLYRVTVLDILDSRIGSRALTVAVDRDALGLAVGDPARSAAVRDARTRLVGQMRAQGHPFAAVPILDAVVDHDRRALELIYVIEPGPAARFGPIRYVGLDTVDPALLDGRRPFAVDDPFRPADLAAWREALAALGLFASVRIVEADSLDDRGRLPLTVEITERPLRVIGAQAGWATDLGAEAEVFWRHRNLVGRGEAVHVRGLLGRIGEADVEALDYRLDGTVDLPDIGRPYQTLTLAGSLLRESPDAFTRRAVEAGATLARPLWPDWTGRVGGVFETSEVDIGDAETFTLFGLPLGLSYDDRDDPLDPTTGVRLDLDTTPFLSVLGATGAFTVFGAGVSSYWAPAGTDGPVLAGRARLGSIWGAGLGDVPSHRRLFAGGGGSVRGFAFQAAGPREADGDPAGGLSAVELSVELRQRLSERIGLVGFVDAGTVYQDPIPDPNAEPMRVGAGIGVRYFTPVGPLRVDLAAPLNPEREDDAFQIYLSIGQAF